MDDLPFEIPDWAASLLHPSYYQTYSTYSPYLRQAYSLLSTVRTYTLALIAHVSEKPDLATIALLLVIIFVSLKILDILWQTLMFWVRMVRRVVFWGGLLGLATWMWVRGPEGCVEDFRYWVGVWQQEKEGWVERERVARAAQGLREGRRPNGWY